VFFLNWIQKTIKNDQRKELQER